MYIIRIRVDKKKCLTKEKLTYKRLKYFQESSQERANEIIKDKKKLSNAVLTNI